MARRRAAPPRRLQPAAWPRPAGYSNGFAVPPGRTLVVTGGMIGWDERERLVAGGFAPQFEQALRNVVAVVREGGGGAADVVRMTVYVVDRKEYLAARGRLGAAWKRVMGRHFPAMALVEVKGLVEKGARVEIEAIAAVAGPRS